MLNFLKNIFTATASKHKINWRESLQFFRDRKSKELHKAEEQASKSMAETSKLLQQLDNALEDLEDYSDRKGIEAVEDVADNFYSSRKKMIEEFRPPEEFSSHIQELNAFLEDFEDVSRKESAVMKRVKNESGQLFSALKALRDHVEKMQEQLENSYRPQSRLSRIEQLVDEIDDLEEEIEKTRADLENTEPGKFREEASKIEDNIEELEDSEEWENKKSIETELKQLRTEKQGIRNDMRKDAGKIERGLKKLVYSVENGETGFSNDLEKLKQLKGSNFSNVEQPGPELREAREKIREQGFLGERQEEKFVKASKNLESFEESVDEISELEEDEKTLVTQLDSLKVDEKKKELDKKLETVEKQRKEEEERVKELEEQLERLESEKASIVDEVESVLNSSLRDKIIVEA